jgi:hypothetical protein
VPRLRGGDRRRPLASACCDSSSRCAACRSGSRGRARRARGRRRRAVAARDVIVVSCRACGAAIGVAR